MRGIDVGAWHPGQYALVAVIALVITSALVPDRGPATDPRYRNQWPIPVVGLPSSYKLITHCGRSEREVESLRLHQRNVRRILVQMLRERRGRALDPLVREFTRVLEDARVDETKSVGHTRPRMRPTRRDQRVAMSALEALMELPRIDLDWENLDGLVGITAAYACPERAAEVIAADWLRWRRDDGPRDCNALEALSRADR
jgi:hypothetical protein